MHDARVRGAGWLERLMMMKNTRTRFELLVELLVDAFTADEILCFLNECEPFRGLPAKIRGGSQLEVTRQIVELMEREALLNGFAFSRLAEARPRRAHEFLAIAESYGCHHRQEAAGLRVAASVLAEQATAAGATAEQRRSALVDQFLQDQSRLRDLRRRGPPSIEQRTARTDYEKQLNELEQSAEDRFTRLTEAMFSPETGMEIAGMKLLRRIPRQNQGTLGELWTAHPLAEPDRVVTMKIIRRDLLRGRDGEAYLYCFRRSYRALEDLKRGLQGDGASGIVELIAVSADGLAFAMEFVPGKDLGSRIGDLTWTPAMIIDKFRKLCEAVAFSHRCGVVHCDIHPGNILLDAAQDPKLTDFDFADFRQSWSNERVAAVSFAAPERLYGGRVLPMNDVYSLGRILHFLLIRRVPPSAFKPLELPSGVPKALHGIIIRATQYDPENRYQSVAELLDDLDRFLSERARAHWRETTNKHSIAEIEPDALGEGETAADAIPNGAAITSMLLAEHWCRRQPGSA